MPAASALPLPLPATPSHLQPASIEQLIGELTAAAACLFAQGLGECWRSGQVVPMSAAARQQGGAVMSALIELREHTAGKLNFTHTAQVHGARVLQERCGGTVSQPIIEELVAAVLEILGNIVRLRLN